METPTYGRRLAAWAAGIELEDLPAEVVDRARWLVLDQLGLQVRGATLPNVRPERLLVEAMRSAPESSVTLSAVKATAPYAAYLNGTYGHSSEYDDSHMFSWHASSVVLPTALAFAERRRATGRDVLLGVVIGTQVMSLIGAVVGDGMQRAGWHGPSVLGPFGAAAVAGRLLGLDADGIAQAFGIAGSSASGTMEYDQAGGEVKRTHAGIAARSGSQAALLAADGLTGPLTIFEGPRGIFRMFGGTDDFSGFDRAFGRYQILDTMYRFHPAIATVHAPLDALAHLRSQHDVDLADIAAIRVGLADFAVGHGASITRPTDALSAQFSLAFSVGLFLVTGHNRPQDYFEPANWSDPRILAAGDLVEPYAMPIPAGVPALSADVEIELRNGRRLRHLQHGFRGHPACPVGHAEIEAKFRDCVDGVLTPEATDELVDVVAGLDELADLDGLTRLLRR